MTNNEGMRPHELARQMMDSSYEINNGRVESVRLAALIDRSQTVWHELANGKFDADENGYASIGVQDWVGDYRTESGDHVDRLTVQYHDPTGATLVLGSIARLQAYSEKATASVAIGEGKYEPLLPADSRWNAVVGVVERAVEVCHARRQNGQEGRS